MLRQKGITVFELLIGLSIMSGVSLYTMKMTEEVEEAVEIYQNRVQDVQTLRAKLKPDQYRKSNSETLFDGVEKSVVGDDFSLSVNY